MIESTDRFVAKDGLSLHIRSWAPATAEPTAAVALLHGGAEHSGRYAHTAARFTAAGLQVDALDQRSHGASERVRGVGLQIDRFDDMLQDTESWLDARRAAHRGRPLFVVAHSMGALIAVTLASQGRLPVDGLVTTGAALHVRIDPAALARATEVAAMTPDVILSRMPRGGFDGSTRDPDMRAVAFDDQLHADVEGVPAQFLAEIAAVTASISSELSKVRLPFLALHGTADTMADPAGSVALAELAASEDKTLYLWPDGYHALLRDIDRHRVETMILEWISARSRS